MDNKQEHEQASVPYFIHEGQMARMERIVKRLIILLVAAIALFIVNNVIWMKYTERQVTEARLEVPNAGVHQQSDSGTD